MTYLIVVMFRLAGMAFMALVWLCAFMLTCVAYIVRGVVLVTAALIATIAESREIRRARRNPDQSQPVQ